MKKFLTLISLAVLLIAGCAKEPVTQNGGGEGDQTLTVTVALPDASTRATADYDGNAKKANHWVFEVRDAQNKLFYREVKTPAAGTLTQTFNVSLIKNQSYNLLFWADNATGNYYDTDDLTNVTVNTFEGNDDARDAFTACKAYTSTKAEQVHVTLYRPFAQVNVITTDLAKLWAQAGTTGDQEAAYMKFEPKDYSAVVSVPTSFNVLTQQCGNAAPVTITADATYVAYKSDKVTPQEKNNYALHINPATLFMDYVFASKGQKDVVDIAFQFTSNNVPVNYAFTSIPLQANYRTNIKSQLLSYDTEWVVEIEPAWESPEDTINVFEATINNISALNGVLASNEAAAANEVTVTTTMPTDSNDEEVTFTVKNDAQAINLNFEGNLGSAKTITFGNEAGAEGPATLNVIAPSGTKLVFNNPMTHVVINGTSYDNIQGEFSASSLIIAEGVTVNNLSIAAGGLEIYGTVNNAEVTGTKATVFVRDCRNINNAVYAVLKDYIAEGYVAKANGSNWDIVLAENWINYAASSFLKVEGKNITINSPEQLALLAKNVLGGNTYEGYTIKLGGNINLAGKEWTPIGVYSYRTDCADGSTTVSLGKPFKGVFDGNGYKVSNLTIKVADNGKAYNGAGLFGYMTAGTIKNLTVTNPDIEGRLYVGAVAGYPYTGTAIENCQVTGDIKITASWYCGGVVGNGYINTIKDCSIVGSEGSFIKGVAAKYNDGAAGYFGGIIGFRGEGACVVENCAVENIDITAECNGVGGIAGILQYGNTVKNCSLENVNVKIDTDDADETPKVALYAGSSTGTENAIGWCINNTATNCTVKTKSSDVTNFVGTKGTKCDNPVHVAGYDVEFNKDGKVIAGLFQAIPASVVAPGYQIVDKEPGLYEVKESPYWTDFAAEAYASKTANAITINTPAQLALLAKEVNNGTSYNGYTITIDGTMDMSAHWWVPINAYGKFSGATIQGTNNALIKTLKIDKAVYGGNYDYYAGFIAQSTGSLTIKDLTFEGAVSVSNGSGIAVVLGLSYGSVTFDNIAVNNSQITAVTKAGAILGFTGGDGVKAKFKNCSINNVTVTSNYSYALFLGLVNINDSVEFEGCTSTDSNAVYDETLGDFTSYKEIVAGDKTYTYGVDGTKLWITGVNNAWAEIRTNPNPTTTIDQITYTIKGDKVFHGNGTTPTIIVQ